METIQLLGSTLGLSFGAGIRLYATVLALGLSIRFGWIHPGMDQEGLRILANTWVIAFASIACVAEFFVDKIPWVNSAWDAFHTFVRPLGAAALAATTFGSMDPGLKLALVVLCGGVAFASHSSKAATRMVLNHNPEPVTNTATNVAVSFFEDLLAPLGVWLSFAHPIFILSAVAVFLGAFFWAMPKVYRSLRERFRLVASWFRG